MNVESFKRWNRQFLGAILVIGVIAFSEGNSRGQTGTPPRVQPPAQSKNYIVPWTFPVGIGKRMEKTLRPSALRLSKILKQDGISVLEDNPICSFWLEIDGWHPNPGQPGYVIILQGGGAVVRATDLVQLDLAIDRIEATKVVRDGKVCLPSNLLLTNYPTSSGN